MIIVISLVILKKEIIGKQQQIEDILINSITNTEEINFKTIPDKLITTNEYGFIIDKKSEENNQKDKSTDLLMINARMEKWNYMIQNYEKFKLKKFEKLKSRTRKGIPDSLRSNVWKLFAEKNRFYQKDLFKKLESRSIKEDMELIIIKDLDRTYHKSTT